MGAKAIRVHLDLDPSDRIKFSLHPDSGVDPAQDLDLGVEAASSDLETAAFVRRDGDRNHRGRCRLIATYKTPMISTKERTASGGSASSRWRSSYDQRPSWWNPIVCDSEEQVGVNLNSSTRRYPAEGPESRGTYSSVQKPPGMPVECISRICANLQLAALTRQGKVLRQRKVLVGDSATSALRLL